MGPRATPLRALSPCLFVLHPETSGRLDKSNWALLQRTGPWGREGAAPAQEALYLGGDGGDGAL